MLLVLTIPLVLLEVVSLLGRSTKDHGTLLVTEGRHPAHALNNAAPPGPGIVSSGSAYRPVATKHDTARAKCSKGDAEPAKCSLENMAGVLLSQGIGHLRETARELHVDMRVFAKSVDGGAPGMKSWIGCDVDDAKVWFAEMV